jgi:hypothetical protein
MTILKSAAFLLVGGLFTLSIAASAETDQVKFTAFSAVGEHNPNVDGVAKIKTTGRGTSSVHLTMSGLDANTTYGVCINGDGVALDNSAGFTTDGHGHAHWSMDTILSQVAGNETICIYRDEDNNAAMTAGEERANGMR